MHSTTLNSHNSIDIDQAQSARFVRTSGAESAQGFAQIMQAFDSGSDQSSELTSETDKEIGVDEPTSQDDTDQVDDGSTDTDEPASGASGEDSDQQGQGTDAGTSQDSTKTDSSDQSVDTQDATQQDGEETNQVDKSQAVTQVDIQQNQSPDEASTRHESALRLLENQSEQAKLTIKGVVRSLTHAATADVTQVSVKTRLEPVAADPQPTNPQEQSPKPVSLNPGADALSTTPPTSDRELPESGTKPGTTNAGLLTPTVIDQPELVPTQSRADQSRADVQQTRSVRVDAASQSAAQATSQNSASTQTQQTVMNQVAAQLNRVESSQSIQTVQRVDAGNIQQNGLNSGTNSGSLVGKMDAAKLPGETNRAGVLAQVQRGLASLLRSGDGEMKLKLTPGHLGEVTIRIKSNGNALGVRIETTNSEASQLLNSSMKELSANFAAKGVVIDQLSVEDSSAQEPMSDSDRDIADQDMGADARSSEDQQSQNHREGSRGGNNDSSFVDQDVDQDQNDDETESVWSELGLDAIA